VKAIGAHRFAVGLFGVTFVAIGVTMIVLTALRGGGLGLLLGPLFVALGAGRLYLLVRR
jgi:hypothetical protein